VRVATALGAHLSVRVLWHGVGLDRLLDAAHAALTDRVLRLLELAEWDASTEVSFNVRGDRGTIDILAFHRATGALLVIEIKSVVPDLQAMLGTLDRKARVAVDLARERRWRVTSVSRLIVLPDDRTARRRVAEHQTIFRAALPARTVEVRRWLRAPTGPLNGLWFLTDAPQAVPRHRVPTPSGRQAVPTRTIGARGVPSSSQPLAAWSFAGIEPTNDRVASICRKPGTVGWHPRTRRPPPG
jgi:hypothetical protein